jgi:hypothetical protein
MARLPSLFCADAWFPLWEVGHSGGRSITPYSASAIEFLSNNSAKENLSILQMTGTNTGENFRSQTGGRRQLHNGKNFQHLGRTFQRHEIFIENSIGWTSKILDN